MRFATQRSFVFAAALVFGVVLFHTQAAAKCARPSDTWSLEDGQAIPARASLFYFAVSWSSDKSSATVVANGKTLKSKWKQVSKNEAFTTYQLTFDAGSASKVKISRGGLSQVHPVQEWTAPRERAVTASLGSRYQDRWTCSHTDTVPLTVQSKAAAFRIEWSDLRNGIVDFGHGTTVYPRSAESFWRHGNNKPATVASIELGHSNCFAYNLPQANLDSLYLRVTPLYRDGSEGKTIQPRQRKPLVKQDEPEATQQEQPSEPTIETIEPGPAAQGQIVPSLASELPTSATPKLQRNRSCASAVTLRLLVIALVLGSLFGLLIFRSHRHGVPTGRLLRAGAVVSLSCGGLVVGATLVGFPYYLLFFAGGLAVLFYAARYLEEDAE